MRWSICSFYFLWTGKNWQQNKSYRGLYFSVYLNHDVSLGKTNRRRDWKALSNIKYPHKPFGRRDGFTLLSIKRRVSNKQTLCKINKKKYSHTLTPVCTYLVWCPFLPKIPLYIDFLKWFKYLDILWRQSFMKRYVYIKCYLGSWTCTEISYYL